MSYDDMSKASVLEAETRHLVETVRRLTRERDTARDLLGIAEAARVRNAEAMHRLGHEGDALRAEIERLTRQLGDWKALAETRRLTAEALHAETGRLTGEVERLLSVVARQSDKLTAFAEYELRAEARACELTGEVERLRSQYSRALAEIESLRQSCVASLEFLGGLGSIEPTGPEGGDS